jgi:hypothetical protein
MTALVIGDKELDALAALRQLAAAHPIDVVDLADNLKVPKYAKAYQAQTREQSVIIPVAFCVTFTIERHPGGMFRHMSMSVRREGRAPIPEAVDILADHLGFIGGYQACQTWIEKLDPKFSGCDRAINIVQPITMLEAGHV